jgi:hypothetical protein
VLAALAIGWLALFTWKSDRFWEVRLRQFNAVDGALGWLGVPDSADVPAETDWPHHLLICSSEMVDFVLALVPALVVYALLFRKLPWDGQTRCRACGHILRGLTEARCPECGDAI